MKAMKTYLLFFMLISIVQGRSITESQCTRPNEEWLNCGEASPCQNLCETLGEECTILNIRCPDGCYCMEGYARDHSQNCIPQSDCRK